MNPEQANKFNTIIWAVTFTAMTVALAYITFKVVLGYLTTNY